MDSCSVKKASNSKINNTFICFPFNSLPFGTQSGHSKQRELQRVFNNDFITKVFPNLTVVSLLMAQEITFTFYLIINRKEKTKIVVLLDFKRLSLLLINKSKHHV